MGSFAVTLPRRRPASAALHAGHLALLYGAAVAHELGDAARSSEGLRNRRGVAADFVHEEPVAAQRGHLPDDGELQLSSIRRALDYRESSPRHRVAQRRIGDADRVLRQLHARSGLLGAHRLVAPAAGAEEQDDRERAYRARAHLATECIGPTARPRLQRLRPLALLGLHSG